MKRAFTLIELLVVIAIIAILAAILFPVFAQAKLAAKKASGLTQIKQINTGIQIYLADFDDVFFPYRLNGPGGSSCGGNLDNCVNPTYQKLRAQNGQAYADQMIGANARNVIFFCQMLDPYIKNTEIWKAPTQEGAWSFFDPINDDTEPPYRSYGGQNSYGVNNYAFTSVAGSSSVGGGLDANAIAEVSNTLILVDASYYNVLPRFPGRLNGYTGPFDPCSSSYPRYWKNLGNSYLFRWNGGPNEPSDAEALQLIARRYSGVLNVSRADTSSKAMKDVAVLNDLRDKGAQSMWDPYKQGYTPCP
jgi:prepilin-type N-terminal cleavage/methylation domain-containing protein